MRIAEKPGLLRTLAAVLAHSGDSWFWLAGLGLIWWLGSDYWKERAIILIVSILLTAIVVFVIKLLVRRKRPEGEWGKFYRSTDPHSFPSVARVAMGVHYLSDVIAGMAMGLVIGGAVLLVIRTGMLPI
jgi:membrane-associated phospholipid phosphatase